MIWWLEEGGKGTDDLEDGMKVDPFGWLKRMEREIGDWVGERRHYHYYYFYRDWRVSIHNNSQ